MKVSIVFEETNPTAVLQHRKFHVYLDGLSAERMREINAMTPEEQLEKLGAAEFWALRAFQIAMWHLKQAGVVTDQKKRV